MSSTLGRRSYINVATVNLTLRNPDEIHHNGLLDKFIVKELLGTMQLSYNEDVPTITYSPIPNKRLHIHVHLF